MLLTPERRVLGRDVLHSGPGLGTRHRAMSGSRLSGTSFMDSKPALSQHAVLVWVRSLPTTLTLTLTRDAHERVNGAHSVKY